MGLVTGHVLDALMIRHLAAAADKVRQALAALRVAEERRRDADDKLANAKSAERSAAEALDEARRELLEFITETASARLSLTAQERAVFTEQVSHMERLRSEEPK